MSLTSWFCLGAEHGMQDFEILSRASATLVHLPQNKSKEAKKANTVCVLSSLHVAYPFLYPQYYDHAWLQYIKPEHVRFSIEIRERKTGESNTVQHLSPLRSVIHGSRYDSYTFRSLVVDVIVCLFSETLLALKSN